MSKCTHTQVTSICLIQSEVTELNSRKTTKRNSELFPSCLYNCLKAKQSLPLNAECTECIKR
ncbi:hypothetical protein C0W93_18700 [Photobacterium leiognathi subsp. mandapamensis]|uniref:Uncharacterized protein n=1 Tax=Photobacterium leiognathi subsp. mandapamensis TaxID=48408 RepID=A0A2T3KQL8_PHOLD|nr:hypothetical protein C0W93_18700 [Photobacterium leiognathi subsp. mandapamensis]